MINYIAGSSGMHRHARIQTRLAHVNRYFIKWKAGSANASKKNGTCMHRMSRLLKCAACTHGPTANLERSTSQAKKNGKLFILITRLWKHSFSQALLNHLPKLRWKKYISSESGFYVMPAASQSEPQDAYREAEKTNTEGCPFCILDAFPSRKYQSSPGMLQNRFTLGRPAILPYKVLSTLGLRLCVYVSVFV